MKRLRRTQIVAPLAICALVTAVSAIGMGGASFGAGSPSATNPAFLPLGDGQVTTAGPRRDYVYACRTGFIPAGGPHPGGGAQVEGPWIRSDGTYDLTAKATVDGKVRWRNATLRQSATTSKVLYEGRWQRIYHYNATLEYPYTLGCFRGTPQT